jgi:hypothetical protein
VNWHAGSAFDPSTYQSLIASSSAVVHTLGILLEDQGYKSSVRGNPLKGKEAKKTGYEGMNRDSGQSYHPELVLLLMISLEGAGYDDVDTEHVHWIEVICLYLSSGLLPTIDTFQVY